MTTYLQSLLDKAGTEVNSAGDFDRVIGGNHMIDRVQIAALLEVSESIPGGVVLDPPVITSINQNAQGLQIFWTLYPDATGYEIWRGTTEENLAIIVPDDGGFASYIDPAPGDGQTFYYGIKALTPSGTSPLSNIVSKKVLFAGMAFLKSTGNNGTAVIGDPDKPFATPFAALSALEASPYGVINATLAFQDDVNLPIASWSVWSNAISGLGDGIRLMTAPLGSSSGRVTLTHRVSFGDAQGQKLRLENIELMLLEKEVNESAGRGSTQWDAGAIYALDENVSISQLTLSAPNTKAANGGNGTDATPYTGSNGADGADGDPPESGQVGEPAICNGTDGEMGVSGLAAWGVSLLGPSSGSIGNITGRGQEGGDGGVAGSGATAVGGNGGNGGDSLSLSDLDGGAGGDGGYAFSNGGTGGNGGHGGYGTNVVNTGFWTVGSSDLTGGGPGQPGNGGSAGSATGGTGGSGGAPTGIGSAGPSGANGIQQSISGSNGLTGNTGVNGSII